MGHRHFKCSRSGAQHRQWRPAGTVLRTAKALIWLPSLLFGLHAGVLADRVGAGAR
jgi:hypothetical protein